ncbi:unnamed protein product [Blepharisma stoltei]|uniref:Uncharacterized protein n=1 Tax=Blepharisma stoltei TaxID=1481888 RepID=A0AAU9K6S6_9CILI|nr:unnamed protein product [Blepharisma stoltei]
MENRFISRLRDIGLGSAKKCWNLQVGRKFDGISGRAVSSYHWGNFGEIWGYWYDPTKTFMNIICKRELWQLMEICLWI